MNHARIRVIVGSKNPVKVNAVKEALSSVLNNTTVECIGIHAPSGVADQPMTAAETRTGAINRLSYCKSQGEADFYVAMEGGVDLFEDGPATFAYAAIADHERSSIVQGSLLPLPPIVYRALQAGEELGDVMDRLFSTNNIKQKGGAIGLLTNNVATRESNYCHALILAMVPFLHRELFDR